MITQQAKKPFSEMEARTEATAWHDQLLHANAMTMRYPNRLTLEENLDILNRICCNRGLVMSCDQIARAVGSSLINTGLGFDTTVKQLVKLARDNGNDTDDLPDLVEKDMLIGLDEYCKDSGIPTTLEPSA